MVAHPHTDQTLSELLNLAHVPTSDVVARRWLADALAAGRALAAGKTQPSLAKQTAPLEKVKRATKRLVLALDELKRDPHAHQRFSTRLRANNENADVVTVLMAVCQAADEARVRRIGRRPELRKQEIVNLSIGFCARFSPIKPSSDENNPFRHFAERFFERTTGLSPDTANNGIGRQIRGALHKLPTEMERAKHLNENHIK